MRRLKRSSNAIDANEYHLLNLRPLAFELVQQVQRLARAEIVRIQCLDLFDQRVRCAGEQISLERLLSVACGLAAVLLQDLLLLLC